MDNLRERIVETACGMFHRLGIRNVSIDDVCNELRISKKTFYVHFPKKEDLICGVLDSIKQKHFEYIEKVTQHLNAIDILIFNIKEMKKSIDASPFLMWYDIKKYYPKLFKEKEEEKMEYTKKFIDFILQKGISEGLFRENLDLELLSVFHSIQMRNTIEDMHHLSQKYSSKRVMNFFIDMTLHLIVNDNGAKYLKDNYFSTNDNK